NGRSVIPLTYEGYYSYRYIRSYAIHNQSLHFQMNNFLEFMLKPYYYMMLPTQYLGLVMYPEATVYLAQAYSAPVEEALSGVGDRVVSYAELSAMCEKLNAVAADDTDLQRVYFYLSCLLSDLQVPDAVYDKLCMLDEYLDFLDPNQQGMTVSQSANAMTCTIGDYTLYTRLAQNGTDSFTLTLPDQDGYTLTVTGRKEEKAAGQDMNLHITVATEEETRLELLLSGEGLPKENETDAIGTVRIFLNGSALESEPTTQTFGFRLTRTAAQPPYQVTLGIDWLHPATAKAAITMLYQADIEMLDQSALKDHIYDNQIDFFHLNQTYLEEYQAAFQKSLVFAVAPILLEMPSGVLNDVVRFCETTGILASFGIE
ncbi:MAG: hypothetical protein PHI98_04850, partial [Eubacteriales bacterium]|nr:hypothetical protein [Eubacteriales bacterium]